MMYLKSVFFITGVVILYALDGSHGSSCGSDKYEETYKTSTGSIKSPGYPGYDINKDLYWLIESSSPVEIEFQTLEMTSFFLGCLDSVSIQDCQGGSLFSGCKKSQVKSTIKSSGSVSVRMKSGSLFNKGDGFFLTFSGVTPITTTTTTTKATSTTIRTTTTTKTTTTKPTTTTTKATTTKPTTTTTKTTTTKPTTITTEATTTKPTTTTTRTTTTEQTTTTTKTTTNKPTSTTTETPTTKKTTTHPPKTTTKTSATKRTTNPTTDMSTTTTKATTTTNLVASYNILCSSNCGSLVKISSSASFTSQCISNCLSGELQYKWSLRTLSGSATTANTEFFHTNAFGLVSGEKYSLELDISSSDGTVAPTATYQFTANIPPTGGLCTVDPQKGYALDKQFILSCDTSNINRNGNQLSFDYKVIPKGLNSVPLNIYTGKNPASSSLSLPVGSPSDGYKVEVIFRITDSIGDYDELITEAVVQPSSQSTSDIIKSLESLTPINDSQSLASATELLQSLNMRNDLTERDVALLTVVRQSVMESLKSLAINTEQDLQLQVSAVDATVQHYDQINLNTQASTVDVLQKMVKFVDTGSMQEDTKANMLTNMTKEGLKLYETANNSLSKQGASGSDVKSILQKTQSVVDNMASIMLSGLNKGDGSINVKSDTTRLQVNKARPTDLNGNKVKLGNNAITITRTDDSFQGACLQTQISISSLNRYMWDNSSSLVASSVTNFDIQACGGNRKRRSNQNSVKAEIDLHFEIPQSDGPYKVNVTTKGDSLVIHHMNVTSPYKPITVSVYPPDNTTFIIYVGFDEQLNTTNFARKIELPDSSKSLLFEEKHTFIINTKMLKQYQPSVVYIGVHDNSCNNSISCPSVTLIYSYQMSEISCLHWAETHQKWATTTDCQVEEDSTPSKVKFKSNLLGSLGVRVFVGPNTIKFDKVFDDIANKIIQNIAVVATVAAIIILYIPLALLCRRLDIKDKNKWKVLPLVDNYDKDQECYEIHVYTGDKRHTSTDSNVYIVVAGTEGDTGVRCLNDGQRKNFYQGSVSSFLLKTSHTLGTPVTVKIWHDSSGQKNDWFLSKIVIVDVKAKKWFLFICEEWLSEGRGYGKTECVTHLARSDDITAGSRLLSNNMSMFTSDHIWLSVGIRKTRSCFTRLQRLSCCLTTIMLTMVANAMWYGTENDVTAQSLFTFGPMSITVHQMYTSIMSSIIIAPPVLAVIILYEKSKPKINKQAFGILEGCPKGNTRTSKRLPYWCVYIAHVLVVLSVATGAFFTILYAFEWGKEKSEEWLGCLFLSVFQSMLLVQPFKVIILIAIYSFILKMDVSTCDFQEEIGKVQTRHSGMMPLIKFKETKVSEHRKKELKKKQLLDKKMESFFYEVLWGSIFVCLLLWIVIGNQDANVYLQNKKLQSIFTGDVSSVKNGGNIWSWLNNSLLPGIYITHNGYNGISDKNIKDKFLNDFNSIQIGTPRIRQQRVKQSKCTISGRFAQIVGQCSHQLDDESMDREDYQLKWRNYLNQTTKSSLQSAELAFTFQSAEELKAVPFWGRLQWYSGSGYVAKFENNLNDTIKMLNYLREYNWIDKYTRVVIVEFSTWNPNTNLFSFVTISFEFIITGGIMHNENIQSVELYRYVGASGLINILVECMTVIIAIVVTIQETIKIAKQRKGYVKVFWNNITVMALVAFYFAVGMYVWRNILTVQTLEYAMNTSDVVSFSMVSMAHTIFISSMGIAAFMLELRLLHALRYIKMISVLGKTLLDSSGRLLSVGLQYFIMFMSFSCLFNLMFGSQIEDYYTFMKTVSSVAIIAFDFRGFEKYVISIGPFGVACLILYAIIVMLITTNLFITILSDFVAVTKKIPHGDHEVVDYIIDMILNILPGRRSNKVAASCSHCNKTLGRKCHNKACDKKVAMKERLSDFKSLFEEMNHVPLANAVEDLLEDRYFWKKIASRVQSYSGQECTKLSRDIINHSVQGLSQQN